MREAIELVVSLTFDTDAALPLERQVAACLSDVERLHDPDSTTGVSLTDIALLDQRSEHDVMDQHTCTIVLHVPLALTAQGLLKRVGLALGQGDQTEAEVGEEERTAAAEAQMDANRAYFADGV